MRIQTFVVAAALLSMACTRPSGAELVAPVRTEPVAPAGTVSADAIRNETRAAGAPVRVVSRVTPSRTELDITFEEAAIGVSVTVNGVSGLRLQSDPVLLKDATVAAGEVRRFEISHAIPEGEAQLGVFTRGTFRGMQLSSAVAVTIGQKSPAQQAAESAPIKRDASGQLVHSLPAASR